MDDRSGGILSFATQGHEHLDAARLRHLLEPLRPEVFPFDHDHKLRSAAGLVKVVLRQRPRLIVMEGTGIAGGVTLILLDALVGVPFVVSSGDAVGPHLRLHSRLAGMIGGLYERVLCRRCSGYVGWTPYLVGRALTFGAPRAMTAPGWVRNPASRTAREERRRQLGIAADAKVVGLVGALLWTESTQYVYGAELVSAIRRVRRDDVVVCIVGDGSGLARLREMAGDDLGRRVLLPGRVPPDEVADYLAAFDIASLSQSVDGVGSFRYSTKLSEYLAAGLPIVTTHIPVAYDMDGGGLWRLPGEAPWSRTYIDALADLMEGLTVDDITARREAVLAQATDVFDKARQQRRVCEFVSELLDS